MASTFRYRGEEPSRIEALSDSCFALAIGLLLISTKSPDTFQELFDFTRDLIPFALCLAMIMLVWYQHFIFFIRYGFRNSIIVTLNSLLLLILLFYVYPLKFLAKFLTNVYGTLLGRFFGTEIQINNIQLTEGGDMPTLMITYGWGVAGIFIVLMLMYRYALKHAEELELNDMEIFETKTSIGSNMLMAGIALLSILLALMIPNPIIGGFLSGCSYLLCWPVMTIFAKRRNKLRKAHLEKLTSTDDPSEDSGMAQ